MEPVIQTRSLLARNIAAAIVALLLAAEVARLTVSSAVTEDNPELALRLAPNAPEALAAKAMEGVGEAAAKGTNPDENTLRRLRAVAISDPLRTEPFLVEAALAARAADYERAKMLLIEARMRDPRSAAARYLYADTAIRRGEIIEGLQELAMLSRLVPATSVQLVPALAEYARASGAHANLLRMIEANPQLRNPLLLALAADPDNADLIVRLAGEPSDSPNGDTRAWQSRLLTGLVARGEYERAYAIWRRFARLRQGERPLLFNGTFRQLAAPPPFNWSFSASRAGIAEPGPHRLRVLYYGRENAALASQLLLLPPGTYRFASQASGTVAAGALSWSLECIGAGGRLVALRLGAEAPSAASFTVPQSGCIAQRLQLNGHPQQVPADTDVRIGPAQIERVGA